MKTSTFFLKWFGPTSGITHAVRALLKSDPTRLFTAGEIRNELLQRGVALQQKNPMATIHQILARLAQSDIVKVSTHEPGRNHYKLSRLAGVSPQSLPSRRACVAEGRNPERSEGSAFSRF